MNSNMADILMMVDIQNAKAVSSLRLKNYVLLWLQKVT